MIFKTQIKDLLEARVFGHGKAEEIFTKHNLLGSYYAPEDQPKGAAFYIGKDNKSVLAITPTLTEDGTYIIDTSWVRYDPEIMKFDYPAKYINLLWAFTHTYDPQNPNSVLLMANKELSKYVLTPEVIANITKYALNTKTGELYLCDRSLTPEEAQEMLAKGIECLNQPKSIPYASNYYKGWEPRNNKSGVASYNLRFDMVARKGQRYDYTFKAHRLMYCVANRVTLEDINGYQVDHINVDISDNRAVNLQLCLGKVNNAMKAYRNTFGKVGEEVEA